MRDDDEILADYERDFSDEPESSPRRKRGFALVAGTLALASVFLLVEIFANRSIGDDISTAQHDLRVAQGGAERVQSQTGTFDGASADGLTTAHFDGGELAYVGPDTPSAGLGSVSVYADGLTWAAAVEIRPGACFYLRLDAGRKDPSYGVGTVCTATQALDSKDSQW